MGWGVTKVTLDYDRVRIKSLREWGSMMRGSRLFSVSLCIQDVLGLEQVATVS